MMDWESIRAEFELSDISLKDLAEKHGISPGTLRSRKNREKWQKRGSPDDATQRKKNATRNATQPKNVATKKKVAPKAKEILESSDLEDWEEVFCLEYLNTHNKTKAYQRARPGTTYESARQLGYRKFTEVHIQGRIGELKKANQEQLFLSGSDIDEMWMRQAVADYTDFVDFGMKEVAVVDEDGFPVADEDGNPQMIHRPYVAMKSSNEVDGTIIKKVVYGRNGVEVELYDKQKAMQELQKRLGDGNGGKQIIINNPWGVPYGPKPD